MKFAIILITCILLSSCTQFSKRELIHLYNKWEGKKMIFPHDSYFTIYAKDTIKNPFGNSKYKIVSYIDSIGCLSCKLKLAEWKSFIEQLDSVNDVSILMYFHPHNKREVTYLLKKSHFNLPVCIDEKDSLNKLNKFPMFDEFRTFLLDKNNKILAIGNPIHNPKIKELYQKIIQGQPIGEEKTTVQTQVAVPETSFTFGDFDWQEPQTHSFEVKNVGHELLVIQDVTTSCGCITVDFPKEPVQPGGTAMVKVTYKADQQEYFNKTVTIYGNAEQFPLSLHVSGNARRLTIDN